MEVMKMMRVKSLQNAKEWYNKNSGILLCINIHEGKKEDCYVNSLEEAREFYCNNNKSFNEGSILNRIIAHEKEIKIHKDRIKCWENYILYPNSYPISIQTSIKIENYKIQEINSKIQNLVKNNVDVEPLYMMHQICK